jgi:hypothetical protein
MPEHDYGSDIVELFWDSDEPYPMWKPAQLTTKLQNFL